jgi:thiol-disulfide isomerase/thioredoxin
MNEAPPPNPRMRRSALLIGIVALVAGAAGAYFSLSRPAAKGDGVFAAEAPKAMPELRFEDSAGRPKSLADFRGKVVLLNLWATWCAPCRDEMPALDRLQAQLGSPSFEVVALSVDQQGPEIAHSFLTETGVKSLAFYIDRSAQAAFKVNAPGLPATLLVDRNGREIGRHLGAVKWDSPDVVALLRRRIEGDKGR